MSKSLLTDKLIETVRIRAMIPDNSVVFSDQDVIDILNEEMDVSVLPRVLDVHEEYYVYHEDIAYSSTSSSYRIPYRAVGNKLREVQAVDSNGNVYELSRIEIDDLPEFQNAFINDRAVFYIKNDYIIFPGNLSSSTNAAYIRMYFYLRPNELVSDDEGGVITAIDRDTGIITLSAFPTAFSSGDEFDFVSRNSSHKIFNYDIKNGTSNSTTKTLTFPVNKDITSLDTSTDVITIVAHGFYTEMPLTLTTTGTLPTGLSTGTTYYAIKVDADTFKLATSAANAEDGTAIDITASGSGTHTINLTFDHIHDELDVGDYVCLAQETIVPQLPSELHSFLAQQAALVCVESVGDAQEVAIMTKKIEKMEKTAFKLIDNRVEGAPQKVNPRHSLLKSSKFR